MKKVYLSGPITGKPNKNHEAFRLAELDVARAGNLPINPHRVCAHLSCNATWIDYMRVCVAAMMEANTVFMLRGWIFSKGARAEWIIAGLLRLEINYQRRSK